MPLYCSKSAKHSNHKDDTNLYGVFDPSQMITVNTKELAALSTERVAAVAV